MIRQDQGKEYISFSVSLREYNQRKEDIRTITCITLLLLSTTLICLNSLSKYLQQHKIEVIEKCDDTSIGKEDNYCIQGNKSEAP